MSKDEPGQGGLLARMAKFVRHPATSWNDLESRVDARESEFSKQALKDMIERKRRNDFVRKREFAKLRQLRLQEASSVDPRQGGPSFFHTSRSGLPSTPDERAETLKKIDEIEAQMSMQWWKTKGPDTGSATGAMTSPPGGPMTQPPPTRKPSSGGGESPTVPPVRGAAFTPPSSPAQAAAPLAFEQTRPGTAEEAVDPLTTGLRAPRKPMTPPTDTGSVSGFSPSQFFAMDVQEVLQDPALEEAAIRFANGDIQGAEQGLVELIDQPGAQQVDHWLALFDLYRAAGLQDAFERRADAFVRRFGRSAPQWVNLPDTLKQMAKRQAPAPTTAGGRPIWVADDVLDVHALGTLQAVLQRSPQPWVLDWNALLGIDDAAVPHLMQWVQKLAGQAVELQFAGSKNLLGLLERKTPSGERQVAPDWWHLRMAVLRLMNRPDEFELVALDYCVTYEVSPPSWEKTACVYKPLAGDDGGGESVHSIIGSSMIDQVPSSFMGESSTMESAPMGLNKIGMVELSGELLGDIEATLETLERKLEGADVMIISGRYLIRVDFTAAGTLLNWITQHHATGRLVQFNDVHRLISGFFNVIGITEFAKVVLRND